MLAEGVVKIVAHSVQGDVVEMARLWPPTVFGHVAPFAEQPRTAGAETAEPSLLICLHRNEVLPLLSQPQFQRAVLQSLGGLLRRADQQATDRYFLSLKARVAKKLLELVDPEDPRDPELTQVELAYMVGGTRQSVNGIVRQLERHGVISIADRRLHVLRHKELRRLAQE